MLLLGAWLATFAIPSVEAASSTPQLDRIAQLIFQNECAGKETCLTSWNKGEKFASLGIGHFIWYPAGTPDSGKHFSESFPALIHFIRRQGVAVPAWIDEDQGCPWPDRISFEYAQNSQKMTEFRTFLAKTVSFQADFMQKRLENALPRILDAVPDKQRRHIREQFQRVAQSPMGMYALIDYVNFKGEGIKISERYQGHGWGLLQVLQAMQGRDAGLAAIREFVSVADNVLTRRVRLSPAARGEVRWLNGWRKRLQTYVSAAVS